MVGDFLGRAAGRLCRESKNEARTGRLVCAGTVVATPCQVLARDGQQIVPKIGIKPSHIQSLHSLNLHDPTYLWLRCFVGSLYSVQNGSDSICNVNFIDSIASIFQRLTG
jgi:hypothetical protein